MNNTYRIYYLSDSHIVIVHTSVYIYFWSACSVERVKFYIKTGLVFVFLVFSVTDWLDSALNTREGQSSEVSTNQLYYYNYKEERRSDKCRQKIKYLYFYKQNKYFVFILKHMSLRFWSWCYLLLRYWADKISIQSVIVWCQ